MVDPLRYLFLFFPGDNAALHKDHIPFAEDEDSESPFSNHMALYEVHFVFPTHS